MLNRILVPLDGGPAMASALPAIRHLVGGTGAVVHLLLVRPLPRLPCRRADGVLYLDDLLRIEQATWQDYLVHHGSALAYDGIVVRREVRFGALVNETLAAADRHGARLIALAESSPGGLRRFLRPSLADQLSRRVRIPIMVLPRSDDPPRGLSLRQRRVAV
jgi:nucleotide-binding universal stress UspA family protein